MTRVVLGGLACLLVAGFLGALIVAAGTAAPLAAPGTGVASLACVLVAAAALGGPLSALMAAAAAFAMATLANAVLTAALEGAPVGEVLPIFGLVLFLAPVAASALLPGREAAVLVGAALAAAVHTSLTLAAVRLQFGPNISLLDDARALIAVIPAGWAVAGAGRLLLDRFRAA